MGEGVDGFEVGRRLILSEVIRRKRAWGGMMARKSGRVGVDSATTTDAHPSLQT